ncbi:MFS transporter [Oricola sp.]|uniref:MFS transporter n=1 Tax=Oricola sp. TaxID=1979950 RepID=UPI0025CBB9CA|nr:MFS transporter [Oricola sp.]MCI5074181.1 MFS transporter [Oricola sp.]
MGNPAFVVFSNQTFRRLWLAALASNFGGLIQVVGASWHMTTLSASESMVALVQTSITLPIMLFSLAAGVLADGGDRRRIILTAQLFMLVVAVALAVLAGYGLLTPWLLLTLSFLIGCGTALHNPSWQASVGDIVSRENVPYAVSLNAMGFNMVRGVGPAVGGFVVALGGAAAAFALNAVSYIAIIWAIWRWRPARTAAALSREPFAPAFVAGLRYVAMSPRLQRVIGRAMVFGFAAIAVQALLPVVVKERLELGAVSYGVLLGCFGFGAVTGAFVSPGLRARYRNERIVTICFAVVGCGTAVVAVSTIFIVSAVALIVSGCFWLIAMSLSNATVQMSTPRWVLGRTLALYQTGAFGGMAVGGWVWGVIAEVYIVQEALIGAAAVLAFGALVGRFAPFPDFDGLDLDPLDQFREPSLRLDLTRRSGPIKIGIEYEIAEDDVGQFMTLMAERRRVRIRDGARRWSLNRDLENPALWTEEYHVATWTEYLRHHARRTMEDGSVNDRLKRLHKGDLPLRVRRSLEQSRSPAGRRAHLP